MLKSDTIAHQRGRVKHGHIGENYAPVCPADANWNLLFTRHGSKVQVSAEGASTQFVPKTQCEGMEFLVNKFKHGVNMPHIPAVTLVNQDAILPTALAFTNIID